MFPTENTLHVTDIAKAQETDAKLQQKLVSHKDYTLDIFRGGDKDHHIIRQNNKTCLNCGALQ